MKQTIAFGHDIKGEKAEYFQLIEVRRKKEEGGRLLSNKKTEISCRYSLKNKV